MRAHIPNMSSNQKRAMQAEIQRQLAEYDEQHFEEIDAAVLLVLNQEFGFGPKRLKQFYDAFSREMRSLTARYELDDRDALWLCKKKLKDYTGIDISEWNKEETNNGN